MPSRSARTAASRASRSEWTCASACSSARSGASSRRSRTAAAAICTCSSSTPPTRRSCVASARRAARTRSRCRARSAARPRVLEGVALERERLAPLRARATRVVDTTSLSVHELRRTILAAFGPASGAVERMTVRVVSFGFKYGAPADADLVFDVRFLKNPYFVPELKRVPGHRPARARLRDGPPGDRRAAREDARPPRVRRPEVRARGKELPHHRVRLHGRHAPQRRARRARRDRARRHAPRARVASAGRDDEPAPKIEVAVVHRDVARGEPSPRTRTLERRQHPRRRRERRRPSIPAQRVAATPSTARGSR